MTRTSIVLERTLYEGSTVEFFVIRVSTQYRSIGA